MIRGIAVKKDGEKGGTNAVIVRLGTLFGDMLSKTQMYE